MPESFPGLFADPEASGERSFEGLAGPLVCLEFTLEAAGPGCTLVAGSDRFDYYRYSVSTEFGPTESNLWQITQDGRGERVDIGGREGRIDQTNQSVVWEAAGGARVALTGQFDSRQAALTIARRLRPVPIDSTERIRLAVGHADLPLPPDAVGPRHAVAFAGSESGHPCLGGLAGPWNHPTPMRVWMALSEGGQGVHWIGPGAVGLAPDRTHAPSGCAG